MFQTTNQLLLWLLVVEKPLMSRSLFQKKQWLKGPPLTGLLNPSDVDMGRASERFCETSFSLQVLWTRSVPEAHWESLTDRPEEQNSTCLEEQIDSISQVKHGCSQQPVQYCGGNQDRKENKEQTHQWQPHQYTSDYHQYVEATLWRTFAVSDMLRPLDSRQKSSGTDFRQQGDGIKQRNIYSIINVSYIQTCKETQQLD